VYKKKWGEGGRPASFSLLMRLFKGAVIQMLPVCVILRPFLFTMLRPVVDLLMLVPKNFALSVLAFVMRVFSMESSNFNDRRNSPNPPATPLYLEGGRSF